MTQFELEIIISFILFSQQLFDFSTQIIKKTISIFQENFIYYKEKSNSKVIETTKKTRIIF